MYRPSVHGLVHPYVGTVRKSPRSVYARTYALTNLHYARSTYVRTKYIHGYVRTHVSMLNRTYIRNIGASLISARPYLQSVATSTKY